MGGKEKACYTCLATSLCVFFLCGEICVIALQTSGEDTPVDQCNIISNDLPRSKTKAIIMVAFKIFGTSIDYDE